MHRRIIRRRPLTFYNRFKLTAKSDCKLRSDVEDRFQETKGEHPMHVDQFEARLARVRHRFATTLESKISETVVSAEHMGDGDHRALECVSRSYHELHNFCGIGPTVGFVGTGDAANVAKNALIQAYLEKRVPTEGEILRLKRALAKLRQVATSELRSMYQRGG
jgi:hypothetical protein